MICECGLVCDGGVPGQRADYTTDVGREDRVLMLERSSYREALLYHN